MRIPVSLILIETSSGRVEHLKSEQGAQRGIFTLHALQETRVRLSYFKLASNATVAQ
jgi:hypothetical protein